MSIVISTTSGPYRYCSTPEEVVQSLSTLFRSQYGIANIRIQHAGASEAVPGCAGRVHIPHRMKQLSLNALTMRKNTYSRTGGGVCEFVRICSRRSVDFGKAAYITRRSTSAGHSMVCVFVIDSITNWGYAGRTKWFSERSLYSLGSFQRYRKSYQTLVASSEIVCNNIQTFINNPDTDFSTNIQEVQVEVPEDMFPESWHIDLELSDKPQE